MKHYFHDFTAEGVAEPYRLYTGSWRTPTTVKYFGLSEDTLHSDFGFVLVKLQKPRLTVTTEGEPKLMPEAAGEFSKIRIGDEEMVKESRAVQAASGDPRVKALLDTRAVTKTQFSSYPSIFEIRKNARLLDELEFLTDGTQAITALSFRSIGALLPSVQAQDYYNEIVNTQLALWEVNI